MKLITKRNGVKYSIRDNRNRIFNPNEWNKFYFSLKESKKPVFDCLINTGARINEARGIRPEHLSNQRKSVILSNTKIRAKLGEKVPQPRIIAVSDGFYRYLHANVSRNRVLSTNAFNLAIKEACGNAKINDPEQFSSHKFRKTFGTWMLALGVDGFKLAQHLGHTPAELARDYATNDIFSHKDKQIMRSILGNLPERF